MRIFVDWGSTNFRAYLWARRRILDRRADAGAGTLKRFFANAAPLTPAERIAAYSDYLRTQIADWLSRHPEAPIYICGAAGGREGWVETQYAVAPAGAADIAGALRRLNADELGALAGREVYIATGCATARSGRHDVMRGEEVKTLGALAGQDTKDAIFCIPGTHCKWVEVRGGRITRFETIMTGEIFDLLHQKGALAAVLGGAMAGNPHEESFVAGLHLARQGEDTLSDIWQVRAQYLRSETPPGDLSSYLSGILIGHEMRHMENIFGKKLPIILLVDDGPKKSFYQYAFAHCGWHVLGAVDNETAVGKGLEILSETRG